MRWILPTLAAACALGIAVADACGPETVRDALVWLGVHAALVALRRPRPALLWLVAALGAGAAGAIGLAASTRLAAPAVARPETAVVDATLGKQAGTDALPRRVLDDVRRVARLPWAAPGARALPQRVELALDPGDALTRAAPGTRLRAALRIRPVVARRNPGARDARARLRRAGVGARASLVDPALVEIHARATSPRAWLWRWRRDRASALAAHGEGGALLAALALGWRGALAEPDRDALRRLGLSHLLAVSGLHLVLVGGGVFGAARRVLLRTGPSPADPRRAALATAVAATAGYALAAGLPISVRRAFAMLAVPAFAVALRRPVAPGAVLGGAALAILVADPTALFSPAAQLSFAATVGLWVGLGGTARELPPGGRAWLAPVHTALTTSAAAVLATAPIAAAHFGTAVGAGWLANALAVPFTAVVLLPGALAAALLAPALGPAGEAFTTGMAALAQHALDLAIALAPRLPAATGLAPSTLTLSLAAALSLVALRTRRLVTMAPGAFGVSALLAFAPPAAWGPPAPRVVWLDVGQGDATVLDSGGATVLVDAGTHVPDRFDAGARVVVPALRALGIARLDLAVASHHDLDHRGGLEAVVESFPVARLWLPVGGRADPAFAPLLAAARRRAVSVEEVSRARGPLVLPGLEVEVLWPPPNGAPPGNDGSVVLRIHAGTTRVLLPGDLEAAGERALLASGADLRADLLKLAHHGSRTSSTHAFLAAVSPRLAIVSAARFSRWGMPHAEVLERLRRRGISWCWPARDGAVAVSLGAERGVGACGGNGLR